MLKLNILLEWLKRYRDILKIILISLIVVTFAFVGVAVFKAFLTTMLELFFIITLAN